MKLKKTEALRRQIEDNLLKDEIKELNQQAIQKRIAQEQDKRLKLQ